MHISKVSIRNYRNFLNANFVFNKGINTIIGENGSGKTNLFRAVRLILDDNLHRYAYRIEESDFNRAISDWRGHWIIISIEFSELSHDESIQALFVHGAGDIEGNTVDKATCNLFLYSVIGYEIASPALNFFCNSTIPSTPSNKMSIIFSSI